MPATLYRHKHLSWHCIRTTIRVWYHVIVAGHPYLRTKESTEIPSVTAAEQISRSVCTVSSMIRHRIGSVEKAFLNGSRTKTAPTFVTISVCVALLRQVVGVVRLPGRDPHRRRARTRRRNCGAYLERSTRSNVHKFYHLSHPSHLPRPFVCLRNPRRSLEEFCMELTTYSRSESRIRVISVASKANDSARVIDATTHWHRATRSIVS